MSRFNYIQNSFQMGEISPEVYGRTDLEIYKGGAESIINFIPQPQGGLKKKECCKMLPLSATKYLYRFNEAYGRTFYLTPYEVYEEINGSLILTSILTYELPTTSIGDGTYKVNNAIQFGNLLIVPKKNGFPVVLKFDGENFRFLKFSELAGGTGSAYKSIPFGPLNSNPLIKITMPTLYSVSATNGLFGYPLFEVPAPGSGIVENQFFRISHPTGTTPSSAEYVVAVTGYLFSSPILASSVVQATGVVTSATLWGPTYSVGDKFNLRIDTTTGTTERIAYLGKTLTVGDVTFHPSYDAALTGSSPITYTNLILLLPTSIATAKGEALPLVDIAYKADGTSSGLTGKLGVASSLWREGQWSGAKGFPEAITAIGNRLILASTSEYPDTEWYSRFGNFFHFAQDPLNQSSTTDFYGDGFYGQDTDKLFPFSEYCSGVNTDKIKAISNFDGVVSITSGGTYISKPSQNGYKAGEIYTTKSSGLKGDGIFKECDNALVYSSDKLLVKYTANATVKFSYLNVLNRILLDSRITDLKFAASKNLLYILANHKVYVCCLYDSGNTAAFARLEYPFNVSAIELLTDDRLVVVGNDIINIEDSSAILDSQFDKTLAIAANTFTDLNAAPLSGLSNLVFYVDGVKTTGTVSALGVVTTTIAGLVFTIGVLNIPYLRTLNLEAGSVLGNSQGAIRKVDEVAIKLYDSQHAIIGTTTANLEPVRMPTTPFTGEKVQKISGSPSNQSHVIITQRDIGRLYITGLSMKGLEVD